MLHRSLTIGALGLFVLVNASTAQAQKSVSASAAWIRLPAAGSTSTAAFVIIDNPTMYDVYLVSATAEVADTIQFREAGAGNDDGAVVKELTAPAYGKVELKPGGTHLVLNGLKRPLTAGDVIPIVISTENDAMTVNFTVK
jgi:copper(I)-binding protein